MSNILKHTNCNIESDSFYQNFTDEKIDNMTFLSLARTIFKNTQQAKSIFDINDFKNSINKPAYEKAFIFLINNKANILKNAPRLADCIISFFKDWNGKLNDFVNFYTSSFSVSLGADMLEIIDSISDKNGRLVTDNKKIDSAVSCIQNFKDYSLYAMKCSRDKGVQIKTIENYFGLNQNDNEENF